MAAREPKPTGAPGKSIKSLGGMLPFLRPYWLAIGLAVLFLVLAVGN